MSRLASGIFEAIDRFSKSTGATPLSQDEADRIAGWIAAYESACRKRPARMLVTDFDRISECINRLQVELPPGTVLIHTEFEILAETILRLIRSYACGAGPKVAKRPFMTTGMTSSEVLNVLVPLADTEPRVASEIDSSCTCFYCGADWSDQCDHEPACPWVVARETVEMTRRYDALRAEEFRRDRTRLNGGL